MQTSGPHVVQKPFKDERSDCTGLEITSALPQTPGVCAGLHRILKHISPKQPLGFNAVCSIIQRGVGALCALPVHCMFTHPVVGLFSDSDFASTYLPAQGR